MTQTLLEQAITIGAAALGAMATRFLPFMVFRQGKPTPRLVKYLGVWLPSAVFAMLVVYCLKDVDWGGAWHGAVEVVCVVATAALHVWRRQMILSIAGGTALYMLLIHFVG